MRKFNQSKYAQEYNREKYDRLSINVPKGQKQAIEAHRIAKGYESLNQYVNALIQADMNAEKLENSSGGAQIANKRIQPVPQRPATASRGVLVAKDATLAPAATVLLLPVLLHYFFPSPAATFQGPFGPRNATTVSGSENHPASWGSATSPDPVPCGNPSQDGFTFRPQSCHVDLRHAE